MSAATCSAKTRSGGACKRPAGWGTSHVGSGACKLHGGSTPSHIQKHQRQLAREAVETYGLPVEQDPHDALLQEVYRTAGHVAWLGQRVADLDEEKLTLGITKVVQLPDGTRTVEARAARNVWLALYQDERDRLVRVAKAAVEAGVAERHVRIAEAQAQTLALIVRAILSDLGHDLDDPAVRKTVRLRLVEGAPPA